VLDLKLKLDDRKKYLVLAAGILLAAVLVFRIIPFCFQILPDENEIALKEATLLKYRKMAQEEIVLKKKIKFLKRAVERAEFGLLSGKTPSLAAVEIQNILNEIAARSDVEISRVQVLKVEDLNKGAYIFIPVRFTINLSVAQLKKMLYQIEKASKYLAIRNLNISVLRGKKSQQIRSDITVAGVMKKKTG
jgi:hypothetical protein